jgi:hypothetical protein
VSTTLPGDVTAMPGFVRLEPIIQVGAKPTSLTEATADRLVRVVVDLHEHRPDMFEITFAAENSGEPLDLSLFAIGTPPTTASSGAGAAARSRTCSTPTWPNRSPVSTS